MLEFNNGLIVNFGACNQGPVVFSLSYTSKARAVLVSPHGSGNNAGTHIEGISITGFTTGNSFGWMSSYIAIGF